MLIRANFTLIYGRKRIAAMTTENIIYFTLLAIIAEILGTIGGFGSSLFFVPIAGFFLDFYSVLGITALFHLASNISKITLFRNGFDKRLVIRMGIPSIIFVIIGANLSNYFNSLILEKILAGFLICFSLTLILFKSLVIKPNLLNSIGGGALSGLMAGIVGTGGAVRGIVLASFNLEKSIFITTSALIDLGIDLSRSIVYWNNGYVHNHDLYLIPILIAVGFTGTFIAKKILNHFTDKQFKLTVLFLILTVGIITLTKQFYQYE